MRKRTASGKAHPVGGNHFGVFPWVFVSLRRSFTKEKEVVSYTVFLFCPLMYPFIPKKAVRNADHTLVLYSKS